MYASSRLPLLFQKVNFAFINLSFGKVRLRLVGFLLDNAEAQVNSLFGFDHFCRFELDLFATQMLVHSRAATEQYRDKVNKDFVNASESDKLLCSVPAVNKNLLIACPLFRYFERGINTINKYVHATIGYVLRHTV